ncbi:hypothetical protein Pfo_015011 [Paulownia fortunei]|nr:hypothetical protein Pfo_015011 [Paulownia fortunei]
MAVAVEVISRETIKPSNPTPDHLKTFKGSLLDLLNPQSYVPFVFFYANNNNQNSSEIKNFILERRQTLKRSMSETLTRFYPIAGKVKDNIHIDCNDDGVYYVEAEVNDHLSNFLNLPDHKMIHKLLPFHPTTAELSSKFLYLFMLQVNFFECGGIAIGLYMSHQLIDGQSLATFLKAWAASARESSKVIDPSFISTSLFQPTLTEEALVVRPYPLDENKSATRRFVFGASDLARLKEKAAASTSSSTKGPTRVTAVMALIWKCAIAASRKRSGNQKTPSVTLTSVNLRPRTTPPLPPHSIELHSLVSRLGHAISRVDDNFVEQIKGEEGPQKAEEYLGELRTIFSKNETDFFISSS